jgi:hypothetical protein
MRHPWNARRGAKLGRIARLGHSGAQAPERGVPGCSCEPRLGRCCSVARAAGVDSLPGGTPRRCPRFARSSMWRIAHGRHRTGRRHRADSILSLWRRRHRDAPGHASMPVTPRAHRPPWRPTGSSRARRRHSSHRHEPVAPVRPEPPGPGASGGADLDPDPRRRRAADGAAELERGHRPPDDREDQLAQKYGFAKGSPNLDELIRRGE